MKSNLVSLFTFHFFNDGFLASMIIFLPFISKDLNLNLTQVGIIGSVFSVAGIMLSLPVGHLSNRIGAMKILVWLSLFYGLGFLLTGFSISYFILIAAYIVASIGFGSFHSPAFSEVAIHSTKKNKGKTMGDFTAIGEFGRICLSAFIPLIIVTIGWRKTSFIYAFASLIIFLFFLFRHFKNDAHKNLKNNNEEVSFTSIIKKPKLVIVLFITFFDLLASSALFVFLPFLLINKGISPSVLGAFTSAFFVGNLIGKMVLGRLTDFFANTKVFIAAELLMALFVFLLITTNSITGIIIFSVILGSLTMGTVPIRTTMLSDAHNHDPSLAKAFAVGGLVSSVSSAIAPVVLGRIADIFGIASSFYTMIIFAIIAIVPAIVLSKHR